MLHITSRKRFIPTNPRYTHKTEAKQEMCEDVTMKSCDLLTDMHFIWCRWAS